MWNDTDTPLAYLITFRTYGTWLHGDARGSTNRFRNKFNTPYLPPEPKWIEINEGRLHRAPVLLDASQRTIVENAIRDTCVFREWTLYASNVRTNHAHAVVWSGEAGAGKVLNALKSNATRALREAELISADKSPWSDKGSQRYLWNEESLKTAINYVKYGQGDELP